MSTRPYLAVGVSLSDSEAGRILGTVLFGNSGGLQQIALPKNVLQAFLSTTEAHLCGT